jgi:hypothetical protein
MKRLLGAAALVVALVACSHSTTDYRNAAKKAIGSKQATTAVGQAFTDISCESPASTKVGTTFTCTATGKTDGKKFSFTAAIASNTRVEITDFKPVS